MKNQVYFTEELSRFEDLWVNSMSTEAEVVFCFNSKTDVIFTSEDDITYHVSNHPIRFENCNFIHEDANSAHTFNLMIQAKGNIKFIGCNFQFGLTVSNYLTTKELPDVTFLDCSSQSGIYLLGTFRNTNFVNYPNTDTKQLNKVALEGTYRDLAICANINIIAFPEGVDIQNLIFRPKFCKQIHMPLSQIDNISNFKSSDFSIRDMITNHLKVAEQNKKNIAYNALDEYKTNTTGLIVIKALSNRLLESETKIKFNELIYQLKVFNTPKYKRAPSFLRYIILNDLSDTRGVFVFASVIVCQFALLYYLIAMLSHYFPGMQAQYINGTSVELTNGAISMPGLKYLFESLYYSGITFTTIGYGDMSPIGIIMKALSVIQGFIGVSLTVLAGIVLSRNIDND
jgi:hypothetical protein